jgi:thiol-disulfide isomerase/thioredoxin
MDRLLALLIALLGIGALFFAWQGVKVGLRRSIRVDPSLLNGRDRPTLLYFQSQDCAPCRYQQTPILASLRQTLGDSVRFQEYDALEHAEMARRFRVLTIPTTVVIAPDGGVVAVNYGVTQSNKLQHQLAKATTKQ